MIIGKFLRSKTFSQFYIKNFPTLIYEYNRPFVLSLVWMFLEYIQYLMIMLDEELIDILSEKDHHFKWIKGSAIMSRDSSYSMILTYIFLGFNACIILYIVILYAMYCHREYAHYKSTIFSIIIQMYSAPVIVPFLQYSTSSKSPIGVVNILLTVIISTINNLHHQKLSFINLDYLSQRSSSLTCIIKIALVLFGIILVNTISSINIFPVFPLVLSLFGIAKFWLSFPYIDEIMNKVFFYLNIFTMLSSSVVLIYINSSTVVSIFFQIFTVAVLAYKLAHMYYNFKVEYIKQLFSASHDAVNWQTDIPPYAIDFFIRDLVKQSRLSLLTKEQKKDLENELIQDEMLSRHMKTCTKRPYCYCEGIRSGIDSELQISIEEKAEKRRLIIQTEILQIFDNYLKNQKKLNYVHISYLFYLHDKVQNYLLINTQIYEYINEKKTNLIGYDMAHLKYILYKNMSSSKLNSNLQIEKVFMYDDKINIVKSLLSQCILEKLEILKLITDDVIDLVQLEKKIKLFLKNRKNLEQNFREVLDANSFCTILQNMLNVFLFNVSFVENKDLYEANKKILKQQKKVNEMLFQKNVAVIFISLMNLQFGIIKQVSKNFEHVFEIPSKNAIGYNCNILMPPGISAAHNNALRRYIATGSHSKQNRLQQQPMLAQNKSGFVFQIKKQFEIYTTSDNDLGLIGLVTQRETYRKEDFLVINLKQLPLKIEACSRNIFLKIFHRHLGPNKEYQNICLSRIFPMLPYLVQNGSNRKNNLKQINLQFADEFEEPSSFETVGFFPEEVVSSPNHFAKQHLNNFTNGGGGNLHSLMQEGEFSLKKNRAYLIKFKLWYIKDELVDQCTIHIELVKHLCSELIAGTSYELLIIDQLKKFCSLNYSVAQLRAYLNIDQPNSSQNSDQMQMGISYEKQSFPHNTLEQAAFDIFRSAKHKEFNPQIHQPEQFNNHNHDHLKNHRRNSKLLRIQNEIIHNDSDLLQIENTNHNIFSLSTIHSPHQKQFGDFLMLQNTPRMTDREMLVSNGKNSQAVIESQQQIQLQPYSKHIHQQPQEENESDREIDVSINKSKRLSEVSSEVLSIDRPTTNRRSQFNNVQSVSTSINSQFKGQKISVINSFKSIKSPFFFQVVRYLSILCLTMLLILILVVYLNLKHLFEVNTKNFYYISWGNNLRVAMSRCYKSYFISRLVQSPIYNYLNDPNMGTYINNLRDTSTEAFQHYKAQLIEVGVEQMSELSFLDILYHEDANILFSYNLDKQVNITANSLYVLSINLQYMFQVQGMLKYDPVIEQNSFSNFLNIAAILANVQSTQEQSVLDTFDKIKNQVNILLLIITTICAAFLLIIFPAYSFSQSHKQRIYGLFSTIDSQWIKEMHRNLIFGLQALSEKNTISIQNVKKYENIDLFNKKKSISSTTILPKFSFALFISSLILYAILIIYPIVNLIITNDLIEQSNNNQDLQGINQYFNLFLHTHFFMKIGVLQTTKAAYMSLVSMYSLYANSVLFPSENNFQKQYTYRFGLIIGQASTSLQNLYQIAQVQLQRTRYHQEDYDAFAFEILKTNACDPIFEYPQFVTSNLDGFDQESCKKMIDGQLAKGLSSSLRYFLDIIQNIQYLHQISDPAERDLQLKNYFQKYPLLELNKELEYIKIIIDVLNDFIYNNSLDFFDYMQQIQTILMIYQFAVLIAVNQLALVLFFKSIGKMMSEAKNTLTIFEVRYLIENPYIMSFLNKSQ